MDIDINASTQQGSALRSVSLMGRVRAQSLAAHQRIVVSAAECGLVLLRAAVAAALRCCPPVCNVTRLRPDRCALLSFQHTHTPTLTCIQMCHPSYPPHHLQHPSTPCWWDRNRSRVARRWALPDSWGRGRGVATPAMKCFLFL